VDRSPCAICCIASSELNRVRHRMIEPVVRV
jgi:hypothetical protein